MAVKTLNKSDTKGCGWVYNLPIPEACWGLRSSIPRLSPGLLKAVSPGSFLGRKQMKSFAGSGRSQCVLTLLASLFALAVPSLAQEAGRIIGVATDPSGSMVPHAKVTVTNVDTNIS